MIQEQTTVLSAKEKAEELINSFKLGARGILNWTTGETEYRPLNYHYKETAILAVNELEKLEAKLLGYNPEYYSSEYWQEVKNELEKS